MSGGEVEEKTSGETALLIIDLINDLDFSSAEQMLPLVMKAAEATQRLREAADEAGVRVVYVNDNFGHWQSERSKLIASCAERSEDARRLIDIIHPRPGDYFLIKPRHSGFYATNLPVLLPQLGATRLILTGVAADICVLFTAADAHMRDYRIWCPGDCVAAATPERTAWALEVMRAAMHAETRPTTEFTITEWVARAETDRTWKAGEPAEN
jgi:nicotinamidase-related amidase